MDCSTSRRAGKRAASCECTCSRSRARSDSLGLRLPLVSVKSPEDAVLVDLDSDGATDVVSCCEGGNRTIYVHWAPTDRRRYLDPAAWRTEAIPATAGKQMWMFALPLQIDGSGSLDLVVGAKGAGATIGWLRSPAGSARNVSAWEFRPLYQAGWIMSLVARDMDGDGDLDVLASDRKGARRGVLWLENPGPEAAVRGASWAEHRIGPGDREVMFLTVADLNGDRRPEVVCAVRGGGIAVYRRPAGETTAWDVHEIAMPAGCGTGKAVAVGDVDLDGRQDIVFTCENATGETSGVRWLAYRDSPWESVWQDHEISGPQGLKYDLVELLDLDHDGDLDALTCEERDNLGVIWYENPTR